MKQVVKALKEQLEMTSSSPTILSRFVILLSSHFFKDEELIQNVFELLKPCWVRYKQYCTIYNSENPQQLQEVLEQKPTPRYIIGV